MKLPIVHYTNGYIVRNIGDQSELATWKANRNMESDKRHRDCRSRVLSAILNTRYTTLISFGPPKVFRIFGFDIVIARRASRV